MRTAATEHFIRTKTNFKSIITDYQVRIPLQDLPCLQQEGNAGGTMVMRPLALLQYHTSHRLFAK